ncbi:FecR family protein [Sphingomonas aerophila]|uniref:Transmembrane sensor n=1 Tax=Sphingomonas aerophila TaxID=1344948 RepID=A0A7W9BE64_9SPHN|nr:FecR domain-containing protein [Sphingomonas aerophila]MBB5715600.1 transmembrane sensor [Sphingomonas aerophila]
MSPAENSIDDAAVAWLIRQRAPDFDAWEAFAAWLEADGAHADAYHRAAAADRDLDELLASPAAASQPTAPTPLSAARRSRPWPRWVGGGAIAAALALAVGLELRGPTPQPYAVATAAGERRTVDLGQGTRIALNGATRLTLNREEPRRVRLESGQALFVVAHDASHPFEVTVGNARVVDVGTTFEITRIADGLDVAVAEGEVVVDPTGAATRLTAGQAMHRDPSGQAVRRATEIGAVGEWQRNRLSYDGAPLSAVAADLSRNLGVEVVADPVVAGRPFRGVLILDGGQDAVASRLPALLGVSLRRTNNRWRLVGRP